MSILKLKPSCKDYLWGGTKLRDLYHKPCDFEKVAESWELSTHPAGQSRIAGGEFDGMELAGYFRKNPQVLGSRCQAFEDFPILIKFIDAKQALSIQVHPDNRYALKNEGQYGKTEMWYVMDAGKDAFLYYGFKEEISREEFARRIQEDTLLEVLNAVPVQKGDVLFIESGTIHAIGKNILIAEIQQNSNITYRVYDYGRVGKDGKKRDLHIEKALAVTNRIPIIKDNSGYPHVADCDYFTVDKLNLDGKVMQKLTGKVSEESFASILILDGEGTISNQGEILNYKKGDSFFLPAGSGKYTIKGTCDALITTIRAKAAQVRIGIDIGGTDTKIGLIDVHQHIIAKQTIKTNAVRPAEKVIDEIGKAVLALLEQQKIPMDQCVGVGIGIPGTVDRKQGIVRYSNNIGWEDVDVVKEMEAHLPIPIYIANDADCAALGETIAGAGRDYQDVIMLTLGTGVGGGIILDGSIYEGKGIGGSELGHMVIVENGEQCTCGRKGCLEAYVSATALIRDARKSIGKELTPEEIFSMAREDEILKEIVDSYIRRLGVGIVNIVNIFRPQLVLLGGGIAAQGEVLTKPLSESMMQSCFGKNRSEIPEIRVASLGNEAGIVGAAGLI